MGVSNELYYIGEGFPNEAYCLNKRNDEIEVYYSERGKKRGTKYFLSEDEACEYFLEKVFLYFSGIFLNCIGNFKIGIS